MRRATRNRKRNQKQRQQGIVTTVHPLKKRNNGNVIKTSELPRIVMKNLLSAKKYLTVKVQDYIYSRSGSPLLQFGLPGSSTNNFVNIAVILSNSNQFTDFASRFMYFRITGIKLDVQRAVSEDNISTIYASGSIPQIFLLFMPSYTSTTIATTSVMQASSSFEVDPFITERQRVAFNFPMIYSSNNLGATLQATHSYGAWNQLTTSYGNMPGQIGMNSPNTENALTTSKLYFLTYYIDVEVAGDLGD